MNSSVQWNGALPMAEGKDRSKIKSTPLLAAIQKGHIDVVDYLFKKGGKSCLNFNWKKSTTPLEMAMQLKDPFIRKKMALLVVNAYKQMAFQDYKGLHLLIEMNDTKLLTDILKIMDCKEGKISFRK